MASDEDHKIRLEGKIDKIVDKIGNIDITLAKQSVILEEHIRRTELLEAKVEPLEKHAHMVGGALKLIGVLAAIAAIVEGLFKVLGF